MRINFVGKHTKSLLADFDAAGINYEIIRPAPGVIMNSGELVDFAKFASANAEWAGAIALVLRVWLHARASRRVSVTLPDGTIVQTDGFSEEVFAKAVSVAKNITALDTGGTSLKVGKPHSNASPE
jgi:hypothetical protein